MIKKIQSYDEGTVIDAGRMRHIELTDVEETLTKVHGEEFTNYRREWDQASELKIVPERPLYITLEINNYCNMLCKMCSKNYVPKEMRMDITDEIVDKVVREIKKYRIPSIIVGASTECLINPKIISILEKIKASGVVDAFLITNGYCLTDEIIDKLIELEWERVYISIDAAKKETYKTIRGMDLDVVETNVKKLIQKRNESGKALPLVRVSYVRQSYNFGEEQEFYEKWKNIVDIIDYQELIDYSGFNDIKEVPEVDYRCQGPFRVLTVQCDGQIFPCTSDYCFHMPIGNIKDISLLDAWNSEVDRNLRKDMLSGKLNIICRNCAAHTKNLLTSEDKE